MRKKGENSVKCAGKSAIPPDKNNDFTLGGESQSVPSCGSGRLSISTGWTVRSANQPTTHLADFAGVGSKQHR
jgi:hypothetical protein